MQNEIFFFSEIMFFANISYISSNQKFALFFMLWLA